MKKRFFAVFSLILAAAFFVAAIADFDTLPPIGETVEKAIFKGLTASSKDTLLSFGKIKGLSI